MAYYVPAYAPCYAIADPEHDRAAVDLAVRDQKEKEEIGKSAQLFVEKQKAEEDAKQAAEAEKAAAEAEKAAAEAAAEKAKQAEEEAAAAQERAAESKKEAQEQLDQYTAQRTANQATESERSVHAMSPQRVRLVGGYAPAYVPPPLTVGYPPVYSPYYPPIVAPVYAVPDPVHASVAAGLADKDAKEKEELGKAAQQYCEKKKEVEEAETKAQEGRAAAEAAKEEAEAAAAAAEAAAAAAEAAEEKSRQAKEEKDAQLEDFASQGKKNKETELECVVHASSPRRLRLVPAVPAYHPVHYAVLPPPPVTHCAAGSAGGSSAPTSPPPPVPPPADGEETEFARAIRERDEACERASVARARADPTTA